MRICVLGAGVIGVSTAYFLAKDGHDVTVIDRAETAARETSFANGGQISVSHTDPWASPDNFKKVLGWLGDQDAPLVFKPSLDPALLRWIWLYLKNCTKRRAALNTERMLRVATYSQTILGDLRQSIDAPYEQRFTGILHIYRQQKSYAKALKQAEAVTALGIDRLPVSKDRALEIEPTLGATIDSLSGIIYAPTDESGNARVFTENLVTACRGLGVTFRFQETVKQILNDGVGVSGVRTDKGQIEVDCIVVALGSYSPLLLRSLGIKLPVYPAKGYSVTLPVEDCHTAPVTALIDDEKKLVYSRLGDRLRIAGLAETVGYDTDIHDARARLVLSGALELFPNAGNVDQATYWTGLRPQTPDSVPVLGATPIKGLYLNTGHGTLGWTMSAGSARVVADIVSGKTPEIDIAGLGLERFG